MKVVVLGDQGCTPGYWKVPQHWDSWPAPFSPTKSTVASVFSNSSPYGSLTLVEALKLQGGKGTDGAKQILLRAAVAAILNEAHPGVDYPYADVNAVISAVNEAIRNDTQTILPLNPATLPTMA